MHVYNIIFKDICTFPAITENTDPPCSAIHPELILNWISFRSFDLMCFINFIESEAAGVEVIKWRPFVIFLYFRVKIVCFVLIAISGSKPKLNTF